jgi:hypothetical protein
VRGDEAPKGETAIPLNGSFDGVSGKRVEILRERPSWRGGNRAGCSGASPCNHQSNRSTVFVCLHEPKPSPHHFPGASKNATSADCNFSDCMKIMK